MSSSDAIDRAAQSGRHTVDQSSRSCVYSQLRLPSPRWYRQNVSHASLSFNNFSTPPGVFQTVLTCNRSYCCYFLCFVCNKTPIEISSNLQTAYPLLLPDTMTPVAQFLNLYGLQWLYIELPVSRCCTFVSTNTKVSSRSPFQLLVMCRCLVFFLFVCVCVCQILVFSLCGNVTGYKTRGNVISRASPGALSARLSLLRGLPIMDSTHDGADYTVDRNKPDRWTSQRL